MTDSMTSRAMVLEQVGGPLVMQSRVIPDPRAGELQIAVEACAVCRTDLHILDGELVGGGLPRIPGHQIVGTVTRLGAGVTTLSSAYHRWLPSLLLLRQGRAMPVRDAQLR